jgi:hypothetical protein
LSYLTQPIEALIIKKGIKSSKATLSVAFELLIPFLNRKYYISPPLAESKKMITGPEITINAKQVN